MPKKETKAATKKTAGKKAPVKAVSKAKTKAKTPESRAIRKGPSLVVVESPAKERTISRFLKND